MVLRRAAEHRLHGEAAGCVAQRYFEMPRTAASNPTNRLVVMVNSLWSVRALIRCISRTLIGMKTARHVRLAARWEKIQSLSTFLIQMATNWRGFRYTPADGESHISLCCNTLTDSR
jgi:hypothetical protein